MMYLRQRCCRCGRTWLEPSVSSFMSCPECRGQRPQADRPAPTSHVRELMYDVVERAACAARRPGQKVGDFWFDCLSEEEREVLRGLTSGDLGNVRVR